MKTIRLIAGILLLITGVLHVILYAKTPDEPGMIGYLVFGIIYAIIGLLLFTRNWYPVYLGLILPSIGFTICLIKFGFPALVSIDTLLYIIDVIVIICCIVLIVNRKKISETTT